MDDFKSLYEDLIIVEEEIEQLFLAIANSDLSCDIIGYRNNLNSLNSSFIKENSLMAEIVSRGFLPTLMTEINTKIKDTSPIRIMLKHKYSIYYRLKERLELFIGGDVFDYIYALKADYSRLALGLIIKILPQVDANLKSYLLFFKYSLIYINLDCENDLINGENTYQKIELLSIANKKNLLYTDYLDEGILLSPSKDNLLYLESLSFEDLTSLSEGNALIAIISILASLGVCGKDDIRIFNRFQELLNSEETPKSLIELINLCIKSLEELKNNTTITR